LPRIRFRAAAGKGTYWCDWDQHWLHAAEPGTLALPDARLLSPLLTGDQFRDLRLDIGASSWATPSLVVSNASLTFDRPGFALEVTNDLIVADGSLGVGWTNMTGLARIAVGGDLVLDPGGALYLYAGATNGTARDYGACLSVTGGVRIGADAWIYPYAHNHDGGTVLLRMSNLVVAAAGGINADAKGYDCDTGPGRAAGGVDYPCGGGYGGHGGDGKYSGVTTLKGGIAYGSVACPIGPGSGGGSYQPQKGNRGGAGGGAIRIAAAGTVTLDGTLSAGGENGDHASGGGAGGAIHVACRTFGGTGLLRADGGGGRVQKADGSDNYSVTGVNGSGGGGGGRIAVDYQNLIGSPTARFSTAPGNSRYQNTPGDPRTAGMGTIHLADDGLLGETLTGIHGNLVIAGVDSWSPASLTVSNAAVGFAEGFRLLPAGTVAVTGAGSMLVLQPGAELACGGDLVLTNGASMMVYSGPTNGVPGDCGAKVDVTGTLRIATNCWVYPYARGTDDSAPLFNVGSLRIAPGGGFNANAAGYRESLGCGKGGGPGAWCAGAGHGGKGGRGSATTYLEGKAYGSTFAPQAPGSGGGDYLKARVGARGGRGRRRDPHRGGARGARGRHADRGGRRGGGDLPGMWRLLRWRGLSTSRHGWRRDELAVGNQPGRRGRWRADCRGRGLVRQ
ncbi:MAG: hypothetical protein GX590_05635, partial [Lentisphaerae bacterium]|nr:hypothetical protein [Lentisphaerota bacterium]